MSENVKKKLHRNRIYSIPSMKSGGKRNCFSRSDFLEGRSHVKYGHEQHPDIFTTDESKDKPELWTKRWSKAGKLLRVPKVVILSDFIAWPEYWSECVFDMHHEDLVPWFTNGIASHYTWINQWNVGQPWRVTEQLSGAEDKEFRWNRIICRATNPYFGQHQALWDAFREAKRILESEDDPIYVIIPNWMPKEEYQIVTKNHWNYWFNFDAFWSGDEAHGDVMYKGLWHPHCDIFEDGGNRGRIHPDPDCPYWRSDANNPPRCPTLLSGNPAFGTDVLHIWIGHWCYNWGGPQHFLYETYPISPAGMQFGSVVTGGYLGSPVPMLDGARGPWQDARLPCGYSNGGKAIANHYGGLIDSVADEYKSNFYKYRNFATRWFPWTGVWGLPWNVGEMKKDEKWCPSFIFYFGFTFADYCAMFGSEDTYFIDYSDRYGIKYGNGMNRGPSAEDMRRGINNVFPVCSSRAEEYYYSLESGSREFFQAWMERCDLGEYNVVLEEPNDAIFNADGIVEYVRGYFESSHR